MDLELFIFIESKPYEHVTPISGVELFHTFDGYFGLIAFGLDLCLRRLFLFLDLEISLQDRLQGTCAYSQKQLEFKTTNAFPRINSDLIRRIFELVLDLFMVNLLEISIHIMLFNRDDLLLWGSLLVLRDDGVFLCVTYRIITTHLIF